MLWSHPKPWAMTIGWPWGTPCSMTWLRAMGSDGRALPPDRRSDVLGDRLEQVRVVLHAELVRDGEQERAGLADPGVLAQLLGDDVRLADVAAAEARDAAVDVADLVGRVAAGAAAEVHAVQIGGDGHDAAADGDAWRARPARLQPGGPVQRDLLGLQVAERHTGVLGDQRRALDVHALLRRPH